MASNMPTEDSSSNLARSLFSLFQSGGASFFTNHQLLPDVLVDGIKNKLLGGYNGVQHAVSRYVTHAAPRTETPESIDLEFARDSTQRVSTTGREPEGTLGHLFRNNNNPFTSEADDSDVGADQTATRAEYSSNGISSDHPKRSWMWIAAFIAGVLSVIVLPGLVVGVMTRQMSWGFELSGAIAPIVSLLAGLYYHHNK